MQITSENPLNRLQAQRAQQYRKLQKAEWESEKADLCASIDTLDAEINAMKAGVR